MKTTQKAGLVGLLLGSFLLNGCLENRTVANESNDKQITTSIPISEQRNSSNFNGKLKNAYVTSCINDNTCTTENKEVKQEDRINLNAVVEAEVDGKEVYFSDSDKIAIDGKRIDSKNIKKWDYYKTKITWYKIDTTRKHYSNWNGVKFRYDTPKYEEIELDSKNWTLDKKDLGTTRYKINFEYNNIKVASPGSEAANEIGAKDSIHRISVRKDDSFVGWLYGYFNLPYVYGSMDRQVDNYIGADCADLVIWAYNKSTGKHLNYTNVRGLSGNEITKGNSLDFNESAVYKNGALNFGGRIKTGDLIIFDNSHVGVLSRDSGPDGKSNGVLDGYDKMIDIFLQSPRERPLGDYPFNNFKILRLK